MTTPTIVHEKVSSHKDAIAFSIYFKETVGYFLILATLMISFRTLQVFVIVT